MLAAASFSQTGNQTRTTTAAPPVQVVRPDSINESGLYDYWANMTAQGRAGGVLLGKLAVEGEPLPWEPILVSVDGKGQIVTSTQTDTKGQFVISFIDSHGVERNPQDAQRQMETHYEGCTVQATVAGFRSNALTITQRHLRDDPNIGTIMLSPEGRGGGTEISSTSTAAPATARKAFERARGDWVLQNADGATRNLKKAVQLYPAYAQAWLQLGKIQESSDRQAARDSFSKALAADPNFILPYEQLAALDAQEGKWQETLENTSRALQLDPAGTPQIWYYDALANLQLGNRDAAEASALKALTIDPRHTVPNTEQLLAVILARRADYAGALQHLRNSLTYITSGPNADLLKQQIAQLQQKAAAAR